MTGTKDRQTTEKTAGAAQRRCRQSAKAVGLVLCCVALGCARQWVPHAAATTLWGDPAPAVEPAPPQRPKTPPVGRIGNPSYVARPAAKDEKSGSARQSSVELAPRGRPEAVRGADPEDPPLPPDMPAVSAGAAREPDKKGDPPRSTGPSTLHVDDMDVRKVFEILSRQSTLNILVSPEVAGRVTVDLKDMPAQKAIEAVAELCHLETRREGNLVYVYTLAEGNEKEEQDLPVRIYHLTYAKGVDLEKMVKPLLSKRGVLASTPESEMGIKTDSDKAGGDSMAGGDVLLVQDHERVLKAVDRVVAQLDVQPIQVLIEAIIVSVKLENGLDLGVNFGVVDSTATTLGVLGSGAAINAATGFTPAKVLTAGGKVVGDPHSGFAEDAQGLKFGFVDKNATGFIRALRTFGETKVLASPRVLVLNKQRAEIQLGDRLGYKTLTQTQTSTVEKVEFMNVGTQLRLRPFVSADGLIRMEIHPERSSGTIENGIPQTSSAQVTTNVMVPDGATLVIGGLMQDEKDLTRSGIPLLCDLPVIGPLFRRTQETLARRELIVILTPHIWSQQGARELNGVVPAKCLKEARARAGIPPSSDDEDRGTILLGPP